ncbi:hypothetical protein L218DRAFT_1004213 [Marasmius fiardii PR-910]|nr:hypothetical protein L218DRAFT_1004213 [Marasmius fiardii PR-910]
MPWMLTPLIHATHLMGNGLAMHATDFYSIFIMRTRLATTPLGMPLLPNAIMMPAIATVELIEDDIAKPHRENAKRYKAKVSSLKAKLSSLQAEHNTQLSKINLVIDNNALKQSVDCARCKSNTNPHNTGRGFLYSRPSKHGSNYCRHCDDDHSTISQSNHPPNTALTTKPIDWDNFSLPFSSQEMGFSVLKHSRFRTGFDQSLVTINWDEAEGLGHTSALVDRCISTNTSPTPTVFTKGTQTGIQSIPSSHANLESLVGGTTTEGNISTLHCLQFALIIAQMLEQTRDIDPQFLNSRTYHIKEAPHEWKNSIQLPVVGAPQDDANCHNYVVWAHYMFIFGDSNALLGIFMSDTGYIDLKSVRASRILYNLTSIRSTKDRLAFDAFHLW